MGQIVIKLKSGETKCGALWSWRPHLGWFSFTDDESGNCIEVQLADCESVIEREARHTAERVNEDEDLLARARKDGWAG